MNILHKDEINIIIQYLDENDIKSLAYALYEQNSAQSKYKAFEILNCAVDKLMSEREEINLILDDIYRKLTNIENISADFKSNLE